MDQDKELWDELMELRDDLNEWLQLLEAKARAGPDLIWANFSTRQVVLLVKKLLLEFDLSFSLLQNHAKEKKEYKEFGQRALEQLRQIERSLQ